MTPGHAPNDGAYAERFVPSTTPRCWLPKTLHGPRGAIPLRTQPRTHRLPRHTRRTLAPSPWPPERHTVPSRTVPPASNATAKRRGGGGGGGTGIDWGRGSRSGRPQEEKPTMKILVWSAIAGTGALGIWMWLTGGC
jgi:hypothetical protein